MHSESPNPNNSTDVAHPVRGPEVSFPVKAFASGLFSGYSPAASGTVGSAVAVAIYCIPGFEQPRIILPVGFLAFVLGVNAAQRMEEHYGHDPAEVTIDEVVGMWISLLLLPKNIPVVFSAFILFRVFDIIKPFPARKFDSVTGGLGIMMDDVVAGFYTNLIIQLLVALSFFEPMRSLLH